MHYNADLPLKLDRDASFYAIGVVISRILRNGEERQIAFASQTLRQKASVIMG